MEKMNRLINISFAALVACMSVCPGALRAAPAGVAPKVSAELDTAAALIGDRVTLTLSAIYGNGQTVRFPDVSRELPGFELLDQSSPLRSDSSGYQAEIRSYQISPFETGVQDVGPFTFTVMLPDGTIDSVSTGRLALDVQSLLPDSLTEASVKPLKPIIEWPRLWKKIALWAALIVFLGIVPLILLLRWYLRKRAEKFSRIPLPEAPSVPPHLAAFDELERIKRLGLIEKGEIKLFHELVSQAIRVYIRGRYEIDAPDMTTWEIMYDFKRKVRASDEIYSAFREFFEFCDLVKFAKYKPKVVEINAVFNRAYDLVERTKPHPTGMMDSPPPADRVDEAGKQSEEVSAVQGEREVG